MSILQVRSNKSTKRHLKHVYPIVVSAGEGITSETTLDLSRLAQSRGYYSVTWISITYKGPWATVGQ